jgi:hypothetical protein
MKTVSRSRTRWLPFALVLVGACTCAMSANQPVTPAGVASAVGNVPTIPPYGVISHHASLASATVLPYGAVSHARADAPQAVLPYGAITRDTATASAAVLPYGAVSPRAAP